MEETFDIYEDITYNPTQDQDEKQEQFSDERSKQEERNLSPPQELITRGQVNSPHFEDETSNSTDHTALYIGNLTWWTTDQDLEDLFCPFGKLKNLRFFEDKNNGKSKGYALVEYLNPEVTQQAKEKLQSKEIYGRPCIINFVSAEGLKQLNRLGTLPFKKEEKKDSKPYKINSGANNAASKRGGLSWSGRSRYPTLPVPDPRMLGPFPVAPHINPAFWRDQWREERRYEEREREREREKSDHHERKRERDEKDEKRRDSRERDEKRRDSRERDEKRRDSRERDEKRRHKDNHKSKH